jgi:NitT/TauT family transport system substrate-binding protein
MRLRALATVAVLATAALGAAACGDDSGDGGSSGPVTLRLGYFPNITHAPALVGVEKGIFAEKLGGNVKLETTTFNAGPAAVEAIFSGALDATYIGPNPTVNAFSKSKGEAIRVISGAASGGVALVVKPDINSVEDLKGKKIATPQLGNTQDVALRYWLKEKGITTTKEGGGDVSIVPQENAQTLETFSSGAIQGAWVPEPFVSRLVNAGGKVLVDERDLWPDGRYVTTHLLVNRSYLDANPEVVKRILLATVQAVDFVNDNPDEAQAIVNAEIEKFTTKPIGEELLQAAWGNLTFTNDPIASSLQKSADDAIELGLLEDPGDLAGLYDLTLLNEVLVSLGKEEVAGL